jgi:hypothetical protein
MQIDHIDGDTSNNRMYNLREVDAATQMRNLTTSVTNTSGRMGVSWNKSCEKWEARIRHDGKAKYLGLFLHKKDAVAAREDAERLYGYHRNHGKHLTAVQKFNREMKIKY